MPQSHKTHKQQALDFISNMEFVMKRIVLINFLPNGNEHSRELHSFWCRNSLVVIWDDMGVGLHLRICLFVQNELACYIMNNHGSDGCHVCFTGREYTVRDNVAIWLALLCLLWRSLWQTTRIALCIFSSTTVVVMHTHFFFLIAAKLK